MLRLHLEACINSSALTTSRCLASSPLDSAPIGLICGHVLLLVCLRDRLMEEVVAGLIPPVSDFVSCCNDIRGIHCVQAILGGKGFVYHKDAIPEDMSVIKLVGNVRKVNNFPFMYVLCVVFILYR